MPRQFHIVWPERRTVSEAVIRQWFDDAEANGELGVSGDLSYEVAEEAIENDDVGQMATALDQAGLITLYQEPV